MDLTSWHPLGWWTYWDTFYSFYATITFRRGGRYARVEYYGTNVITSWDMTDGCLKQ